MPTASSPPLHASVALHHKTEDLWQMILAPEQDEAATTAHLSRWDQALSPTAKLLVDMRSKSFSGIAAQKAFSLGSRQRVQATPPQRLALLINPEETGHLSEPAAPAHTSWCSSEAEAWSWLGGAQPQTELLLMVGSTGAGKTTLARWLAHRAGGLCYSIDQWMRSLFKPDQPQTPSFDWYWERILRAQTQMRSLIEQHLPTVPAVLDVGLTTAEHRQDWIRWGESQGWRSRIYYVDVDAEARWARVQQRNLERGPTFELEVTRAMFDFMENRFEPPTEQEGPLTVAYW